MSYIRQEVIARKAEASIWMNDIMVDLKTHELFERYPFQRIITSAFEHDTASSAIAIGQWIMEKHCYLYG